MSSSLLVNIGAAVSRSPEHGDMRGKRRGGRSRGLPLPDEDAGERELERGLHHLHRQGLQRQRQLALGGRGAGEALQVDVRRR